MSRSRKMAKNVILQIEQQISNMTTALRKVSEFILNDPMKAAFSTIDQIAHQTQLSTASVIRLATSLGYNTFSDFQKELKDYLQTHAAPINRLSINAIEALPEEEGANPILDICKIEMENISLTAKNLNADNIGLMAKALNNAKRIFVVGARTSESTAKYLSYNLDRMFLNAKYVGDSPAELLAMFKQITPDDVLIAITLTRYNKNTCQAAKFCKENAVTVIAMTDSYDAPLVPYSSFQLISSCKSNSFQNSTASQIFLCDVLIKYCSLIDEQRVRKNLEKDEEIVKRIQLFVRK